jgi:hypothetical protein
MPSIRYVSLSSTELRYINQKGIQKILLASQIPPAATDAAKVEAYINNTWIPANLDPTEFTTQVHIFSIQPLNATIFTANVGEPIPPNWWQEAT